MLVSSPSTEPLVGNVESHRPESDGGESQTESTDIGACCDRLEAQLLWRDEGGRSHNLPPLEVPRNLPERTGVIEVDPLGHVALIERVEAEVVGLEIHDGHPEAHVDPVKLLSEKDSDADEVANSEREELEFAPEGVEELDVLPANRDDDALLVVYESEGSREAVLSPFVEDAVDEEDRLAGQIFSHPRGVHHDVSDAPIVEDHDGRSALFVVPIQISDDLVAGKFWANVEV